MMRICSGPGCLRAVNDDARLCSECQPTRTIQDDTRVHTSGYDSVLDTLRKSRRWQRLRIRVIQSFPICARCGLYVSEIADHIVPALVAIAQAQLSGLYPTDRYAGYFLFSNLQGLCRECHWIKTNEDKLHVGEWPDVVAIERNAPKRKWCF